jgi:hypothetical protein
MRCRDFCVFLAFVLLVVAGLDFSTAATVDRIFSDPTPIPGGSLTVSYDINPDTGTEDYFVIRDSFPAGWNVADSNGGNVGADSVWTIQVNPPYGSPAPSFTLDVPLGATATYNFDGDFAAVTSGSGTASGDITGDNQVDVQGGLGTILQLQPSSQNVEAGDTFTIDVYVQNAVNLYGVQFDLDYDENLLTLDSVMGDPELFGGGFDDSNSLSHNYDQPGIIDNYFIIRGGGQGATGSGKVATITFTVNALASGVNNLALSNLFLSDPDSISLSASNVLGTSVTVGYCGDGSTLAGLEQCDDGKHCYDGTSYTSCTLDSECTGIGDELCMVRDGTGCSSICTLTTCAAAITANGGGENCAPASDDRYCSPINLLESSDSAECCAVACQGPQLCSDCGGIFQLLGFCDYTECTDISEGCYYVEQVGPNDCASCVYAPDPNPTDCTAYGSEISCEDNSCVIGGGCVWDGSNCVAPSPEVCDDTVDNDNDGDIDCADSECAGLAGPDETVCCADLGDCAACQECDAGGSNTCVNVTSANGNMCNDECTECVSGSCDLRSDHDYTECGGVQCAACDGVSTSCQPDDHDSGYSCFADGWECVAGSCCVDADNDGNCDTCAEGLSCNDDISCTTDSCDPVNGCVFDVSTCDCSAPVLNADGTTMDIQGADINNDGTVGLLDLQVVFGEFNKNFPEMNELADVVDDGSVNINDLIFVAVRVQPCP